MSTAIYPGSFDPVTNGHLDIVQRATRIFDEVIITIAVDNYKNTLFSVDERLEMLRCVVGEYSGVKVETFSGLLIHYVRSRGATAIIRGLRAVSDFEYEMQLAMMNKKLAEDVETVFFTTSTEYSFLSSSVIKQVASLGGCVRGLVPQKVELELKRKYTSEG